MFVLNGTINPIIYILFTPDYTRLYFSLSNVFSCQLQRKQRCWREEDFSAIPAQPFLMNSEKDSVLAAKIMKRGTD